MTVVGIGLDIEQIHRFEALSDGSLPRVVGERVFTAEELAYCQQFQASAQHLAGRFAAKEAVIKAFSSVSALMLSDVEIIARTGQAPRVVVHKLGLESYTIHLSITHTEGVAAAMVVVEAT